MPLHTVEPQRLYRQIAGQLRGLIEQGEFAVGDRLPAERELAVQLGVSRPSVREALIALEVEGWVEVRTGSGVYVQQRPARSKAALPPAEWGPLELIRARRVIEGETAALAAKTRKRGDLAALKQAIADMGRAAASGVAPLDADRDFHLAIVAASGNAVLVETVQTYWTSRRGPLFTRLGGYFENPRAWGQAIAEHQAIHDAIAARDADAARAAMHRHLDRSHARFSASWQRTR